ncbi:uncharacterized protein CIMG_07351 [Coccidioides immitis RS]|uniref:Uncharacterized protein n=1 Tax=Coccidioides immitis (strain RS) TaxID=246410 RepID=J3KA59_COCIM|nr:uncharacterized protein CIMG_07351 [Coccidioides immitis RS]EAS31872.3 hypothetical protein CIMG_07351 [Coccidioides immitis RS]
MHQYPAAFRLFRAHCRKYLPLQAQNQKQPRHIRTYEWDIRHVLITPPQPQDYNPQCPRLDMRWKRARKRARGRGARRRARGVANTTAYAPAAPSKKHWIVCLFMSWHYGPRNRDPSEVERFRREGQGAGKLFACKFNSGLFAVPWEQTREVPQRSGLEVTVNSNQWNYHSSVDPGYLLATKAQYQHSLL